MGVVNASPESFSDGGVRSNLEQRLELADELVAAAPTSSTSAGSRQSPTSPRSTPTKSATASYQSSSG
jgi:dihydropteroate synthase